MTRTGSDEPTMPRWAPRVRPALVRRLYEADAKGIVDVELIDEVGYALWARCETIRRVTDRLCPECGGRLAGVHRSPDRHRPIACVECGWASTWGAYHRSYKGRRIHGGRAFAAFTEYIERFEAARTPQAKMREIDRLIHAVHEAADGLWTSPGAMNLIDARRDEILPFLNELAGLDGARPEQVAAFRRLHRKVAEGDARTRARNRAKGLPDWIQPGLEEIDGNPD
jgi:hypothetical protein